MGKAKQKRSQAPVALVYFTTLLVFMCVFGLIAYHLILKMEAGKESDSEREKTVTDKHFSLLVARQSTNGKLGEAAYLYFAPDEDAVIIVPMTRSTVDPSKGKTFEEVYDEDGTKGLKSAAEAAFDIKVDHYITLTNPSFESICDVLGGITYIPQEELYMLAHEDVDDISYRKGRAVEMDGKQIRQLLQSEKVFSKGEESVIEFYGDALLQMAMNGFKQANQTKDALDNIYNLMTKGSDNDYSKSDYRLHKSYLEDMLDRRIASPAILKDPDGTWDEDGRFKVASTFVNELKEVITNFGGKITTAVKDGSSSSVQTASQAAE